MRTLTDGSLTVIAYDGGVWLQENNVLTITNSNQEVKTASLWMITPSNVLATYTLDENNQAVVNVSDLLRVQAFGKPYLAQLETLGITSGTNSVTITAHLMGAINPDNVIVPENINRERVINYTESWYIGISNVIVPPQRMLKDIGTEETRIVCEFYPNAYHTPLNYLWGLSDVYEEAESVKRNMTIDLWADKFRTWTDEAPDVGTATIQVGHLQPLECDKRYAAVRWVSFTGATRLHTFELVKAKTETRDATSLLTVDGSYNTIKGRTDGFVLRMDGLNAYDYWYYSDMIHSSRVEVSVDGKTWQRVEVTNNDSTTPDGNAGGLSTLEINVNWRKYDAFNM